MGVATGASGSAGVGQGLSSLALPQIPGDVSHETRLPRMFS